MSESIGKYLMVECFGETIWAVHAKRSGDLLGMIDWHTWWKCYVFQPSTSADFNAECLRDLAAFLEKITLAVPVAERRR